MSKSSSPGIFRGSLAGWLAFGVGLPLGVAALWTIQGYDAQGNPTVELIQRYIEHPVEKAEIVLFFMAMGAILGKLISCLREYAAGRVAALPVWEGQPQSPDTAAELETHLDNQPGWLKRTFFFQRLAGIVDFVRHRGSAQGLDDQIRTLADNDVMTVDGSYALIRLITWAVPILGFLGTVLGITDAIAGVKPEELEQSLSQVTGGLATAFDTTALALALTMVMMFCSYIVEQLENSQLARVDRYVEAQLTHRFERLNAQEDQTSLLLRQHTAAVLDATQNLVERQAQVWARSLAEMQQSWNSAGTDQQKNLTASLARALEQTLTAHQARLLQQEEAQKAQMKSVIQEIHHLAQAIRDAGQQQEKALQDRTQVLTHHLQQVAGVLLETSGKQQEALVLVAGKVGEQAQLLLKIQEGEGQLLQLQQALQHNLAAIAATGTFEQAVESLSGAIHLMTARLQPALKNSRAA